MVIIWLMMVNNYITGWWFFAYPSEKWWSESQLEWWHSQYMESHKSHVPKHQPENVPNHQADNQIVVFYIHKYNYGGFLGDGNDVIFRYRHRPKNKDWKVPQLGSVFSLHKVTIFNFGIIIETFSGLMYKNVLDKVDRYESWYECEVQST